MSIPSQSRVRPIILALTFRDVAENHILPMAHYADHSRRAQLLIQMVDGKETREERAHRYRSVFGASAMKIEDILAVLRKDPIIGTNYEVIHTAQGGKQRDDVITLVYNPPNITPM